MNTRAQHWIVLAAIVNLGAGAALSHVIEPGVRVEKVMLATNTLALRLSPAMPGPHPIAVLAHGAAGSKENMFRFGEALAAAGFDCYSVDQAGHGESPKRCSIKSLVLMPNEVKRELGTVDVYIGHSMGGGIGQWSVVKDGFRPKLFIGVGAPVELGEHGPPTLLLGGLFEEFFRPSRLRAHTNAQVVVSPWSDHLFEMYDPVLTRAIVMASCATVGRSVPVAPTAWRWRFAGLILGMAGAFVLMCCLPELHPLLARVRRFIVPIVLLLAVALTMGTWVGVTPQLRRIPAQLVLMIVIWLALVSLNRLRLPRWSLPVATGVLTAGFLALQFTTEIFIFALLMCILAISTLLLLPSLAVAGIAARGGSRRDADIAMAIFAGYVIGQFMPLFY